MRREGVVSAFPSSHMEIDDQSLTRPLVSPASLLKNPMILIAIVGMGMMFGMPYLMENSTSPYPCARAGGADELIDGQWIPR